MSAAADRVLVARALTRGFRGIRALDGVDIDLAAGEAVALLGPNGAGKTTLLTILAGVVRSESGSLEWPGGGSPRVGWVPQRPALYPRLTARENLRLFAALERADDPDALAAELIGRADLAEFADRPASGLSTGTLQRLNLAIALAGQPRVLLLDEPTATLSPDQRLRLWEWLAELRGGGMALIFSTQSVAEAMRRGDRLVVLGGGHLLFSGTAAEMLAAHGGGDPDDPDAAERAFMRVVAGSDQEARA